MKKPLASSLLVTAVLVGGLATAVPALADGQKNRPYFGVRAIGAIASLGDTKTTGFTGPTLVEHDSDQVAGPAIVGGWVFQNFPLRAEIELGNRYRFDYDVRDLAPASTIDYEIDIRTWQVLFNAMFEWRNSSSFTPLLGGSVGWARNHVDIQRSVLAAGTLRNFDNDQDNVAWGGMVGVNWAFAENWSADLIYRYMNLGPVETGIIPATGETIESDSYTSHDVLLSIYYHF